MLDPLPEAQQAAYPVGGGGVVDFASISLESLPAEPRRWGHLVIAFLVAVTFVSLLESLVATPDIGSPADRYVSAYGGNRLTYERILSSDCSALQTELARATESNTGSKLGSVWHQTTLGYMAAADDQLKAVACITE